MTSKRVICQEELDSLLTKHYEDILRSVSGRSTILDLTNAEITELNFQGRVVAAVDLTNTVIRSSNLDFVTFRDCKLDSFLIDDCSLQKSVYYKCTSRNASFVASNLSKAKFWDSIFSGFMFSGCNIYDCKFDKTILADGAFSSCNAKHTKFPHSALFDVEFQETYLDANNTFTDVRALCSSVHTVWCDDKYVTYTSTTIQVGYKSYPYASWDSLTDDELTADGIAPEWYRKWHSVLSILTGRL